MDVKAATKLLVPLEAGDASPPSGLQQATQQVQIGSSPAQRLAIPLRPIDRDLC